MPALEEVTAELPPLPTAPAQPAKSQSLQTVVTCSEDSSPPTDRSVSSNPCSCSSASSASSSNAKPVGWYASRKGYRSVAYGTWKVGGARKLLSASHSDYSLPGPPSDGRKNGFPTDSPHCAPVKMNTYGTGSRSTNATPCHRPDIYWYQQCYSSRDSELSIRSMQNSAASVCSSDYEPSTAADCYSSQDYYHFKSLKNGRYSEDRERSLSIDDEELSAPESGSELDQSLQTVLESFRELRNYVSLRRPNGKKRYGRKRPQIFGHQRSQSAGSAAIFAIKSPGKEEPRKDSQDSNGAMTATKNFLKKLYQTSTATMPRLSSSSSRSTSSSKSVKDSFKSSTVDSTNSDDTIPPRNGFRSPATLPRPRNQAAMKQQFSSWEEACEHVRRELQVIRRRDLMILRHFQRLEQQLQGIKEPQDGPSPIVELPPNLEFAFSTTPHHLFVPKQSSHDIDL